MAEDLSEPIGRGKAHRRTVRVPRQRAPHGTELLAAAPLLVADAPAALTPDVAVTALRAVPRQHTRQESQKPHPLTGRHAVVVGINYAPEPTGIAPYTTGMATHLARHAASVTVLTGMPHYPSWQVPAAYRWKLRSRENVELAQGGEVHVRRMRHYVPRRQTAMRRAAYEATFLANASAARVPRADVVIAVTPSLGGAVAGARLARRHGVPLIVVVQDLMAKAAGQSGISGGGRVSGATARIEGEALRSADRVAIVSEAFREQLHEYGVDDDRICLLPNWTHIVTPRMRQDVARQALGWPPHEFIVVHTGNIGLKQDLGNVVEAARRCQEGHGAWFYVVGDGSQRDALRRQAAGVANLGFVDPLDDEDYGLALSAADVLLVNERPSVGDMSLPSKLTSYLAAGRPVLAAVSADGATAKELQRTGGAGMRVDPGRPQALADAVLELSVDEARRRAMGAAGRRYAQTELARTTAMARLDALIESVVTER